MIAKPGKIIKPVSAIPRTFFIQLWAHWCYNSEWVMSFICQATNWFPFMWWHEGECVFCSWSHAQEPGGFFASNCWDWRRMKKRASTLILLYRRRERSSAFTSSTCLFHLSALGIAKLSCFLLIYLLLLSHLVGLPFVLQLVEFCPLIWSLHLQGFILLG